MVLIGLLAALSGATAEMWQCTFSPDDPEYSYSSTFVIGLDRVVETGLLPYGYEVLELNEDHLTFARSDYNEMLNAGIRLSQVAVIVTIDRQKETVKKIFLKDHGEETSIQRGRCWRSEV